MRETHTFSRGRAVVMGGRESRTPASVDDIGQVVSSWFRRAWAPSRAVAERDSSALGDKRRGLGSFARSRPRSKVYGVGFWTVTGRGLGRSSRIEPADCAILKTASGLYYELAIKVILWGQISTLRF